MFPFDIWTYDKKADKGQKQVGPGHASFVATGGRYFAIYHASPGNNCKRHAFVEEMHFDEQTGWPYIAFGGN